MMLAVPIFAGLIVATKLAAATTPAPPMTFEERRNAGQVRSGFLPGGPGYQLRLARHEATLVSRDGQIVRIILAGARDEEPVGVQRLQARWNYLVGPDPAQWRIGVANYEKVRYSQVYPGIDLVWYESGGQVEYDFLVAPGADPHRVRLWFGGAAPRLTAEADLAAGPFLLQNGCDFWSIIQATSEANHPCNSQSESDPLRAALRYRRALDGSGPF